MNNQMMNLGQSQSTNSEAEEMKRKIAVVYGIAEACSSEVSDNAMKLWVGCLDEFTALQVEMGGKLFLRTEELNKMPMPAKLIRKIREACGIPSPVEQAKSREMQADAAWLDVRDKISRVGSYGSPTFDPTTARVIRAMGGWPAVCMWETASMAFKRKDFIRLWLSYCEAGDAVELGAEGVKVAVEGRAAISARDLPEPSERRIPSGFLKRLQ